MSFSWLDFITGFLMMGAIVHVAVAYSGNSFPSLFGRSARANLIYSEVVMFVALDIYVFNNSFSALLENGMLLGALDIYLIYLIFGRWIHKRFLTGQLSRSELSPS